jgi:hypothetical protein
MSLPSIDPEQALAAPVEPVAEANQPKIVLSRDVGALMVQRL